MRVKVVLDQVAVLEEHLGKRRVHRDFQIIFPQWNSKCGGTVNNFCTSGGFKGFQKYIGPTLKSMNGDIKKKYKGYFKSISISRNYRKKKRHNKILNSRRQRQRRFITISRHNKPFRRRFVARSRHNKPFRRGFIAKPRSNKTSRRGLIAKPRNNKTFRRGFVAKPRYSIRGRRSGRRRWAKKAPRLNPWRKNSLYWDSGGLDVGMDSINDGFGEIVPFQLVNDGVKSNVTYLEDYNSTTTKSSLIKSYFQGRDASDSSISVIGKLWNSQRYAPWHLGRISSPISQPYNFAPYGQEYYYPAIPQSDPKDTITKPPKIYVYVVDSGIDSKHDDFLGMSIINKNFVAGEDESDKVGHGTAIASVLAGRNNGVVKQAIGSETVQLVSVKVLDKNNSGTLSNLESGLMWCLDHIKKAKKLELGRSVAGLINFSINLPNGTFYETMSSIINQIGNEGNMLLVTSAGNYNTDACLYPPAGMNNTLTASSILPGNDAFNTGVADFGKCVDVLAPGSMVFAAVAGSVSGVLPLTGTSIAAAIASGVAALSLVDNPKLTPYELKNSIISTAVKTKIPNLPANTSDLLINNGYSGIRSSMIYF
ncbi:Subtilase-type proteinase psp3 [Smittium mucronatum]|uniref:Subtilase-type proteinase psp3 n=1 Tax=Smittium mucronatum TaxID=133383 RepID=A0A1R0GPB5_9FUNG|nr:Subtilase-type proteinase psp3 [Smittium mucronatum]